MKYNNLKKNTYFLAIGQVFQKILAFALIPFAARYLGDDGFGKFSVASTIMFFVFLLNDLGITTYITREIAKNKKLANEYYFNSLLIKICLIFINFSFVLIFLRFSNYAADANYAILIFAGYGIIDSIIQLSIGTFEAFERMEFEALVLSLEKIIITGLGLFVLIKGYGLIIFCGIFLVGGLFGVLLSFFILTRYFQFSRHRYKPGYNTIKALVKNSLPFGISLFIATIYNNIGVLILSLIKSPEVVGWFSASFKVIAITNIIPMIMIAATYPAFSRELLLENERVAKLFTRCFKYLSFLAFPLVAGTIILAEKIVLLIYGAQYINSIPALKIMVWTAAFVFYNIFLTGIMKAANLQRLMVKIQLIALAINVILNIVLIHSYSYLGAAITTVCTELFIFICFMVITFRQIVKLQEISFLFKTIFATLIMTIFSIITINYNILIVVGGNIFIFGSSLYLMKGFAIKEILPNFMIRLDK